jgi:hypothetical protein
VNRITRITTKNDKKHENVKYTQCTNHQINENRKNRKENKKNKYTDSWRQVGFLMHVTHLWYFLKTGNKSIVRGAEKIPIQHSRRQLSATGYSQHINPLPGNFRIQEMFSMICMWHGLGGFSWSGNTYTFYAFFTQVLVLRLHSVFGRVLYYSCLKNLIFIAVGKV